MKHRADRIAIIDIGSNSIRLVIYEASSEGHHRLIQEFKESARLSEKVNSDGNMDPKGVLSVVPVLRQFKRIAEHYSCYKFRVTATAAIRNAGNASEIVRLLDEHAGIHIELLSGEQEAYYGFRGVASSIGIEDGFIVDIGGGSTEITLFRNRKLIHSVSLPNGAVNSYVQYSGGRNWEESATVKLREQIDQALDKLDWIIGHEGLPLVGLGGTIRALGKLDQRRRKYPLRNTHHYILDGESIDYYTHELTGKTLEQRRRMEGLSKHRADIIIPGLIILQTIYRRIDARHCLISGTGLREGLLLDAIESDIPPASKVIDWQVASLLHFHSTSPDQHLRRVSHFAEHLLSFVDQHLGIEQGKTKRDLHKVLKITSMLYRIGADLAYPEAAKHTAYWITHAPLAGLTHQEIILCALITEYRATEGKRTSLSEYRDVLHPEDEALIPKLGTLLMLAVALDASATGSIESISLNLHDRTVYLHIKSRHQPFIEMRELEAAVKTFKKVWGLKLKPWLTDSSMM